MAVTYEPISSVTLAADALEISFSSIPGTFTDLVLVCMGNSKTAGTSANGLRLQINSDTASNYSTTFILGNGSTVSSARTNGTYIDGNDLPQASASIGVASFSFMSYANTNVYKTVLMAASIPSVEVMRAVSLWRNTAAITSFKIYRDGVTNLASGYTASLFGIRAA